MELLAKREHSVEKIGGTSISDYCAVRDNIILKPSNHRTLYQRIFVVSAYGGVTDDLLENKKSGRPGIYELFASAEDNDRSWLEAIQALREKLFGINEKLFFENNDAVASANAFIDIRLKAAEKCLINLQQLCQHGHFSLDKHLYSVREMLASIGEAHSAFNTVALLQRDGVNACFIDLSGWQLDNTMSLDEGISSALESVDLSKQLPIVTGYAHTEGGLIANFNRGYSEIIFSRIAVLTQATEAVIHKEFHLSSADPRIVGEHNAIPIGRTNYDVADQLANLGMEAIHPKAAKGLRQNSIPLRIRNTFEPNHKGTTITSDYISDTPRVEIIAGSKGIYVLELFDQEMVGQVVSYEQEILTALRRFKVENIAKDLNANTITHYLSTNLKTMKRLCKELNRVYPDAELNHRKTAIVSAIGSDMQVPGILAKAVVALSDQGINVKAMHQSMRQVDMQFIVDEKDYESAVKSLHSCLVEVHDHGKSICAA
jgi:aspartate kinase